MLELDVSGRKKNMARKIGPADMLAYNPSTSQDALIGHELVSEDGLYAEVLT